MHRASTPRASRASSALLSLLAVLLLAGVARAGCSGTAETYSGAVVKSYYWSSSSVGKGTRLSYSQCESKCDDHADCWKWQFTQGRRGGGCTLHGKSARRTSFSAAACESGMVGSCTHCSGWFY